MAKLLRNPVYRIANPGPGVLALHCRPMREQPALDPRSDYGYKIYYGVLPPGGATVEQATGRRRLLMNTPVTGDELPIRYGGGERTRTWTSTRIAAVRCISVSATKTPRGSRGHGGISFRQSSHDFRKDALDFSLLPRCGIDDAVFGMPKTIHSNCTIRSVKMKKTVMCVVFIGLALCVFGQTFRHDMHLEGGLMVGTSSLSVNGKMAV